VISLLSARDPVEDVPSDLIFFDGKKEIACEIWWTFGEAKRSNV
jgi:hypothetical protein